MNNENPIFEKLRELKPMLKNEYSVTEIGLFGSFSDNTYTDNSDIDILIELERPIGWRIFTLEIFLEKTFGRKIDLVTKGALKEQIKDQILKQVKFI
jgi:predicted nucleotidyltransferase